MQQRWQSLDRYAAQSYLLTQDNSRNNNAGGPPSSNRYGNVLRTAAATLLTWDVGKDSGAKI